MMQGDQYKIPIELLYENGSPITSEVVKELEVFVGRFRKTLSGGEVQYDEAESLYLVHIRQEETFGLIGKVKVQVRILFNNGDVVGLDLGEQDVTGALSKVVLK